MVLILKIKVLNPSSTVNTRYQPILVNPYRLTEAFCQSFVNSFSDSWLQRSINLGLPLKAGPD